jgi:hypothetical protein
MSLNNRMPSYAVPSWSTRKRREEVHNEHARNFTKGALKARRCSGHRSDTAPIPFVRSGVPAQGGGGSHSLPRSATTTQPGIKPAQLGRAGLVDHPQSEVFPRGALQQTRRPRDQRTGLAARGRWTGPAPSDLHIERAQGQTPARGHLHAGMLRQSASIVSRRDW